MITIALPKGRLGDKVYELLNRAGYGFEAMEDVGRKLVIEDEEKQIRYLLVKPVDVAVYVEKGAADLGVVGKDILEESGADIFELLDLGFGKCHMCVAAPEGFIENPSRRLRVATKFVNIAQDYYSSKGRDIDIIKLNGSIEIAPILGLSDVIVDLVETGNTLRANDLEVYEEIMDISARLIANKSGYNFKSEAINTLLERM